MSTYILPWVDWNNGIIMIGIFAAVVVLLILVLLSLMSSGKKR